ncbi:IS1595 family transposase [Tsuneonella sp. HG222]
MKGNRGVSFKTLLGAFPDEKSAKNFMFHHANQTWSSNSGRAPGCAWAYCETTEMFLCRKCGESRKATFGTFYSNLNLPVRMIFYAMLLICELNGGISFRFFCRHLGISIKESKKLLRALRCHMSIVGIVTKLGGPGKEVLIDETVLKLRSKGQATILGLYDRNALILKIIPDKRNETLTAVIEHHVARGSLLVTDGWAGYKGLAGRGWRHIVIRHGNGSLSDDQGFTTAPIETMWRSLKERLGSSLGHVSYDNLDSYLGEFCFVFMSTRIKNWGFWRLATCYRHPSCERE